MSDKEKEEQISALILYLGWPAVYRSLSKDQRIINYMHTPGRPDSLGIVFHLREQSEPGRTPWYWKPALYDVLFEGAEP